MFPIENAERAKNFADNGCFVVTRRDFLDNNPPEILKRAGSHIVRIFRDASSEFLESCIDETSEDNIAFDEPLMWTITQHPEHGVFTVHYVVYQEGHGYTGKCFYGATKWMPFPGTAWVPIVQDGSTLVRFDGAMPKEDDEFIVQEFKEYSFNGWLPMYCKGTDIRTLCGHGFRFTKKTGEELSEVTAIRQGIKILQALIDTAGIDTAGMIENSGSHKQANSTVFKHAIVRYNPEDPSKAVTRIAEYQFRTGDDLPGSYFVAFDEEVLKIMQPLMAPAAIGQALSLNFTGKGAEEEMKLLES